MRYVEAPAYWTHALPPHLWSAPSLFLAGGIRGCPNWQLQALELLSNHGSCLTVMNPRRKDFPVDDPEAGYEQTAWEHAHLCRATAILFWFPEEAVRTLALFELGRWSYAYVPAQEKPIFVGAHPRYPQRHSIENQMRVVHPRMTIHPSLEALIDEVAAWESQRDHREP